MPDIDLTYHVGTCSVGVGDTTVVGVGTLWSQSANVRQWDLISIAGGPLTPIVAGAADDTHISIPAWTGTAKSAVTYVIYQVSPLRFVGGQAMADVDAMLQALNTDGWYRYVNPAYADPTAAGLTANEGQFALKYTTGQVWIMTGGVWVPATAPNAVYGGTSSTSLAIANSVTRVFTTQLGLAYNGARVRAASAAAPANYLEGICTYSGTTLTMAVDAIGGSGTKADWVFSVVGTPGGAPLASPAFTGTATFANMSVSGTATFASITASGNATFGPGTTGTNAAFISIDGGSGAAGGAYAVFKKNGIGKFFVGHQSSILGSGVSDALAFYSSNSGIGIALVLDYLTGVASFTYGPTAPTATPGTNTTQLATTAFVEAARVILVAADALRVKTVKKQIFTASGTYTPSTGMLHCIIECVGSGAGGGGTAGTAGNLFTGGGGGAGSYSRLIATAATIGTSQTVTVGAAGTGGAAGNNDGNVGADVTVGSLCIAKGGAGGGGCASGDFGFGGAGGIAGTGDFSIPGGAGIAGMIASNATTFAIGGLGGNSYLGAGGVMSVPVATTSGNGANATNYGAGGGGGASQNTTATSAGGNGSKGIIIITEFCSQ